MIQAQVNQRNVRAFEKRLTRFLDDMANPTQANRQVSVQLYGWCIRNYRSEGALVGGWERLAPSTIREKERIGKERMLVRTGLMRSSFEGFYSKENAGVRNNDPKAIFHEEGTVKMPARKLLPPRSIVLEIGLEVYGAYVARAARRANRS